MQRDLQVWVLHNCGNMHSLQTGGRGKKGKTNRHLCWLAVLGCETAHALETLRTWLLLR